MPIRIHAALNSSTTGALSLRSNGVISEHVLPSMQDPIPIRIYPTALTAALLWSIFMVVEPTRLQDDTTLTVLRTFAAEFEANLKKTALDAAGIESLIQGGRARTSDFEVRAPGVALVVRAEDVEDAEKILADHQFRE
jgi:hypothetical protein